MDAPAEPRANQKRAARQLLTKRKRRWAAKSLVRIRLSALRGTGLCFDNTFTFGDSLREVSKISVFFLEKIFQELVENIIRFQCVCSVRIRFYFD